MGSQKKKARGTKQKISFLKRLLAKKTKRATKTNVKKVTTKKVVKKIVPKKKAVKKQVVKKRIARKPVAKKKVIKKVVAKKKAKRVKKIKYEFLEDQELCGYLNDIVGKEGIEVVKKISEKEVSDVDLTEKIDMKPNIIRKHLYALYEAGIVTYRRHRSKTGWYTYYWKLHPDRIPVAIADGKNQEVKKLLELLEYEKNNHFYECKKKCTRVVFDEATEQQFKCMKCEEPLMHADNARRVREIEKVISDFKTN